MHHPVSILVRGRFVLQPFGTSQSPCRAPEDTDPVPRLARGTHPPRRERSDPLASRTRCQPIPSAALSEIARSFPRIVGSTRSPPSFPESGRPPPPILVVHGLTNQQAVFPKDFPVESGPMPRRLMLDPDQFLGADLRPVARTSKLLRARPASSGQKKGHAAARSMNGARVSRLRPGRAQAVITGPVYWELAGVRQNFQSPLVHRISIHSDSS